MSVRHWTPQVKFAAVLHELLAHHWPPLSSLDLMFCILDIQPCRHAVKLIFSFGNPINEGFGNPINEGFGNHINEGFGNQSMKVLADHFSVSFSPLSASAAAMLLRFQQHVQ